MQATRTVLKGSPVVNASDDSPIVSELVTVRVMRDGSGRPTGLDARTGTQLDPIVFWTPPEKVATRSRPRQVLFTTVDLRRGERMHIQAKPDQIEHFEWDAFELDDAHFTVATGEVTSIGAKRAGGKAGPVELEMSRATAREVRSRDFVILGAWRYSVVLESEDLGEPLILDPVIIIVEDP